jgi:hypothetical protein
MSRSINTDDSPNNIPFKYMKKQKDEAEKNKLWLESKVKGAETLIQTLREEKYVLTSTLQTFQNKNAACEEQLAKLRSEIKHKEDITKSKSTVPYNNAMDPKQRWQEGPTLIRQCKGCRSSISVTSHCTTCQLDLCQNCTAAHKFMYCFWDHTVVPAPGEMQNPGTKKAGNPTSSSDTSQGDSHNSDCNEDEHSIKVSVPTEFVGQVVGQRGWRIKKITLGTNTTMEKPCSGSDELTITGSVRGCQSAKQQIEQVLMECREYMNKAPHSSHETEFRLTVPYEAVAHIIGKRGWKIKRIQESTNTTITSPKEMGSEFVIIGSEQGVWSAKTELEQEVDAWAEKSTTSKSDRPLNTPQQNRYLNPSINRNRYALPPRFSNFRHTNNPGTSHHPNQDIQVPFFQVMAGVENMMRQFMQRQGFQM